MGHDALQILGSIFGALIYTALIPQLHIGYGPGSPGCFAPTNGATLGDVFGWEVMMTFLLVMTVYAAAVAKPGHGNTAPLAIGLSLYAAAISGGSKYMRLEIFSLQTFAGVMYLVVGEWVDFLYTITFN